MITPATIMIGKILTIVKADCIIVLKSVELAVEEFDESVEFANMDCAS